jgi:hypothetical protein
MTWKLVLAALMVAAMPAWAGDAPILDRQIEVTLDRFQASGGDVPSLREAELMMLEQRLVTPPAPAQTAALDLLLQESEWRRGSAFLAERRDHR